jgi:hypothetical protein
MHELPINVERSVSDPVHTRNDPSVVTAAFNRLGCSGSDSFRAFYQRYAGPFGGSSGFLLLDLVDQDENIVTQTEACRREHRFPERYLVISNHVGNAALVYDSETDAVFDVDFEGSERDLVAGTLQPRWPSFAAFLSEFFPGDSLFVIDAAACSMATMIQTGDLFAIPLPLDLGFVTGHALLDVENAATKRVIGKKSRLRERGTLRVNVYGGRNYWGWATADGLDPRGPWR